MTFTEVMLATVKKGWQPARSEHSSQRVAWSGRLGDFDPIGFRVTLIGSVYRR